MKRQATKVVQADGEVESEPSSNGIVAGLSVTESSVATALTRLPAGAVDRSNENDKVKKRGKRKGGKNTASPPVCPKATWMTTKRVTKKKKDAKADTTMTALATSTLTDSASILNEKLAIQRGKKNTSTTEELESKISEEDEESEDTPGAYRINGPNRMLLASDEVPESQQQLTVTSPEDDGRDGTSFLSNSAAISGISSSQPEEGTLLAAELVAPAIDAIPITEDQYYDRSKDLEFTRKEKARKKKNRICAAVAIILVICIAVGVTVAVVGGGNNGTKDSSAVEPEVGLTKEDVQAAIELQSSAISFEDPTSPQSQALDWLDGEPFSRLLMEEGQMEMVLQRAALATLYFSTGGPASWIDRTSWLSSTNECLVGWKGISCRLGLVTRIELESNNLEGSIPLETLVLLKDSLEVLNLAINDLIQTVPPEIGGMLQLKDLRLFQNDLEGIIPSELANVANLTHLALTLNKLTGTLPALPALRQLTFLDVRDNPLSGKVPDLSTLDSLTGLFIFNTELTGTVSDEICDTIEEAFIDCGEVECNCCTSVQGIACPNIADLLPSAAPTAHNS